MHFFALCPPVSQKPRILEKTLVVCVIKKRQNRKKRGERKTWVCSDFTPHEAPSLQNERSEKEHNEQECASCCEGGCCVQGKLR